MRPSVLDRPKLVTRLEKVIVRLANERTGGGLRHLCAAFPDLMPVGWKEIVWDNLDTAQRSFAFRYLSRASRELRVAWRVREGVLRRVILLYLAGGYQGERFEKLTHLMSALPRLMDAQRDPLRQIVANLADKEAEFSQDGFFQVLLQALYSAHKMRVCQNRECPHPYYLRSEGGKRFCSKACAAPSQRAHKLDWWNRHREALLAKKRAKYRKRKKRISWRKKSQRREKRK